MKLVDILAREMKAWPDDLWAAVGQSNVGSLHEIHPPAGRLRWTDERYSMAFDWHKAGVTRDQWQAAVDALKDGTVVAWNGEGLPPVGAACEYKHVHEWQKVEVFAVKPNHNGSHTALFTYENGTWCGCAEPSFFRRIRTPEQIAAEDRDKAVQRMIADTNILTGIMSDRRIMAGQLYDAGYRKFEIVDE